MRSVIVMAVLMFLTSSGYAQKKLKESHIEEYGTKVYSISKEEIFPIIIEVLELHEYEIGLENLEKGKIKTKRKELGATGVSTGAGTAQFNRNYRGYVIDVTSVGSDTKVVLTPKVWIGEGDVSEKRVWVLNGPAGEIKLWENIFIDIDDRL